jgi:hypothetical protein
VSSTATPPQPASADSLFARLLVWGPIVAGLAFLDGSSLVGLFCGINIKL